MFLMTKQTYRDYTAKLYRGARHVCNTCPKRESREDLPPYEDCALSCPSIQLRDLAGEMATSIRAPRTAEVRAAEPAPAE